jgi:hypothetical protein
MSLSVQPKDQQNNPQNNPQYEVVIEDPVAKVIDMQNTYIPF